MNQLFVFFALLLVSMTVDAQTTKTMKLLPGTGQITSYTNTFGENADYIINPPVYTANGDGTVTDAVTGLQWQKTDGGEMTVENAAIFCDSLTVGGYTDWRLPNCHELFSILNHSRTNPAMNTTYFTTTLAEYWWSSQHQVNDANKVWCTNAGGGVGNHPKTETISAGGVKKFHVRAVRDVTTPTILPNHFINNGNGTSTDIVTGLMWKQVATTDSITWEQALIDAEGLSYAGYNDWRMPNIKELQSINDETLINPSVNTNFFTLTGAKRYWSSTTLPNQTTKAWYFDTQFGITTYAFKTSRQYLLYVRGGNTASTAPIFSIILGRPTNTTITANILFDQNVQFYLEYGTQTGVYSQTSSITNNVANTTNAIEVAGLTADTKYFYRLQYRLTGAANYTATTEYSFETQRDIGSNFSFTVEADEHLYDRSMGSSNLYKLTLANEAKAKPDFMISLGDIFGDDHTPTTTTSANMDAYHKYYRQFLGNICHSVPFFVSLGNHEGEKAYYLQQTPPNNIATYATLWRKFYYSNPFKNNFYSGDDNTEGYGMGNPENYYSWVWGDALFVVLDIYRYQSDTTERPTGWAWSLGLPQYTWLKNTLENSHAKYKFVFAHHSNGEARGGINSAKLYEWGGYEQNGNYTFPINRPGWAKPIQQLFKDNGVNIFFQGHDHLFAKETMDGIVYQEVPMAADSTYESGMNMFAGAYTADTLRGSGHLTVNVSPACVTVDFIRAYLPADTISGIHHNGEVAFSYTLGTCTSTQYTFIGNGNWSDAANWINNSIPPAILPAGSAIVINPISNGQCILNVTQHISTGAIIKVNAGKNFVVQGALLMQ